MTSSNGDIFSVTGHLCGEFTGHRWIPLTKVRDAEHWSFLWPAPWINGWVNNREADDLRLSLWRHCDYYRHSQPSVMESHLSSVESPYTRPWVRSFGLFFVVSANKLLSKLSICNEIDVPSHYANAKCCKPYLHFPWVRMPSIESKKMIQCPKNGEMDDDITVKRLV